MLQWLVLILLAASAAAAVYGSAFANPYSPPFPKRVLVQHHHQLVSPCPPPNPTCS